MSKCFITVKDEVWCTISGLSPTHTEVLWNELGVHVDGYFFMPAYKLGRWDGKIRFFEKTGKTYVRLLDRILPYLEKWGYDIELVDKREYWESPTVTGEITEIDSRGIAISGKNLDIMGNVEVRPGKKFQLRPYQLQCVQLCIEHGSGFIVAGTGAGKTSITAAISYFYGLKGYRIITIVPSGDLVTQTKEWYELLQLDVGEYSGDSKDIDHTHVIATWQAIQYNPSIMQEFQALIWDECFAGSTNVLMEDGTWKAIKDVEIGDKVISMNSDGIFEAKEVINTHANLQKSQLSNMLRLTLSNGCEIEVTENHEFFTNRGKVKAKDLTHEDDICEFDINKMQAHGDKAHADRRNQ